MNFLLKLICPFHRKCREKNFKPPVYLDTIIDKGEVFLVRLQGALDMNVLANNRDRMTAVINTMDLYTKHILIDFKRVTNTDSATVAALLGRMLDIEKYHKRLGLFNIPNQLRQLIEILKVEHNFLIFDDESTALSELR